MTHTIRRVLLVSSLLLWALPASGQVAKRPSAVGPNGVSSVAGTFPGLTVTSPGISSSSVTAPRSGISLTGQAWPNDADDLAHVYFNGTALVDTKGTVTWTAVGSAPTQSAATLLCPARASGFAAAHYYSGGNALTPAGSFTVCALINPGAVPGGEIIAKDNTGAGNRAWTMDLNSTGLELYVWKTGGGPSNFTLASAVTANTLGMVCVIYEYVADGTSKLHAFANGQYAANQSTTAVGPVIANTTPVAIGARAWTGNEQPFSGSIYEIQVINRALTSAELRAKFELYRSWVAISCP